MKEYYAKNDPTLPSDFYLREIAVQPLNTDTYIRHLAFSTFSELRNFIVNNTPRHLYYSSARYQEPGNPVMDEKKWLGSDLAFDIDANEILECIESRKTLQMRFCKKCGYTVNQQDIKVCPSCGLELTKFDHVDVQCINMAKNQALKLADILRNDFGFTNISVAFSGHRGFHVVVELDEFHRYMSTDDRREIVSYIKLGEQQTKYLLDKFTRISKKSLLLPPRVTDGGIRRRIALALTKYVEGDIKAYIQGLKPSINFVEAQKAYKALLDHMNDILKSVSIDIDAKVTIDTTHLIRAPNSINGKTGWRVIKIEDLNFDSFELSSEELSASNARIRIKMLINVPEIMVIDTKFKFSKGDEVVLDYPYASYFVFKEIATVLGIVR
ncbi:MAG: DNA primase small subunit domain-containing protein [Ignisphaera sp.]|uniref:DNA primase small subunit PriS n=1 Tax=Ignisphaera aggregans TaxID=334771 RepID=A0A7C4JJ95_9CREN